MRRITTSAGATRPAKTTADLEGRKEGTRYGGFEVNVRKGRFGGEEVVVCMCLKKQTNT